MLCARVRTSTAIAGLLVSASLNLPNAPGDSSCTCAAWKAPRLNADITASASARSTLSPMESLPANTPTIVHCVLSNMRWSPMFMFRYIFWIGWETVTSCSPGRYCRPAMILTFVWIRAAPGEKPTR